MLMPVECKKHHPLDGITLLDALKEADYDLRNDPRFQKLMIKPVAPPTAALTGNTSGGGLPFRNLPKFHSQQKAGKPCLNERDLGQCDIVDCKALHKVAQFTHQEYTNEIYKKHGVCPDFAHREGKPFCNCKHKKQGFREVKAKLTLAKQEYPSAFAGVASVTVQIASAVSVGFTATVVSMVQSVWKGPLSSPRVTSSWVPRAV